MYNAHLTLTTSWPTNNRGTAITRAKKDKDLYYDLIIIGGGIAGLWLLNDLCQRGYNAILFEKNALGSDQTIASQGMIHGGVKYALSGALNKSSETIGDMPPLWEICLQGNGPVDLSKTKVLSDAFYLWSTQSLGSKLTSFFATKALRGRAEKVKGENRPEVFQHTDFKGNIYKLIDLVLDVPSLVANLAENYRSRIFKIDWREASLETDIRGLVSLKINNKHLCAQRFIFSAGEGNEQLLSQLGCSEPKMQRRPLQQVVVKHDYLQPIYAHCMGTKPFPRLTISSHKTKDDRAVWYLGGDLATENVNTPANQLIDRAKEELFELFPWVDFGNTEWKTIKFNRAEPKQKNLIKPDKAFADNATGVSNVVVCWPTKLTLAPSLAIEVNQLLNRDEVLPRHSDKEVTDALADIEFPDIAIPFWDRLF
jgi:glycine/D-amino acid oxidase-like deaminating enzyme